MTEWPIVQHWKCCVPQGTEGSNPSLSAIFLIPLEASIQAGFFVYAGSRAISIFSVFAAFRKNGYKTATFFMRNIRMR